MRLPELSLLVLAFAACQTANAQEGSLPEKLRQRAHEYYGWRNEQDPVSSSNQGLHTWDSKLADYSEQAIAVRRRHINELLAQLKAMHTDSWSRDDRIDWLLFRAQLEGAAFYGRVLQFEETNPQTYTDECTNAIFSLLK